MAVEQRQLQTSRVKGATSWADLRAKNGLARGTVVVRIPALLHAEVQALAKQDQLPPAAALRIVLQRGLGGLRQDRTMQYLIRLTETIVRYAAVDQAKAAEILAEARRCTSVDLSPSKEGSQ